MPQHKSNTTFNSYVAENQSNTDGLQTLQKYLNDSLQSERILLHDLKYIKKQQEIKIELKLIDFYFCVYIPYINKNLSSNNIAYIATKLLSDANIEKEVEVPMIQTYPRLYTIATNPKLSCVQVLKDLEYIAYNKASRREAKQMLKV